jgi:UDP-glucose 4-epimerase
VTAGGKLVLVTGSAGFIGSALMQRLAAAGIPAVGYPPSANLAQWDQVQKLEGFETIIHLAARTRVALSYEDPRTFLGENFLATLNLLELARRNQARFILASSYVYGVPQYLPVDVHHPTSALNPYMASKLMSENLGAHYQRDFGVPVVVLRIFNAIGPGQRGDFLFPKILRGLAQGRIRLEDRAPRRDFVYIEDVVDAFVAAISWKDSAWDVFNIGSGGSVSVGQAVDLVLRLSGRAAAVDYQRPVRPAEIPETIADIRKASRLLGWKPRVTLEDGIRRMLQAQELA